MTVERVGFVGLRTAAYGETVAVFRDALGLAPTAEGADQTSFRLGDGTLLEVYAPSNDFHAFFATGPVVAFVVPAFDEAKGRLLARGTEFIGEPQREGERAWQHFRLPDGTIAELMGSTGAGLHPGG